MENGKKGLRLCIGCREMKHKKELIRIVRNADTQEYHIDATGKQNGRGAYICKDRLCLDKALKSKGLERSFKAKIEATVYDTLMEEMINLEG